MDTSRIRRAKGQGTCHTDEPPNLVKTLEFLSRCHTCDSNDGGSITDLVVADVDLDQATCERTSSDANGSMRKCERDAKARSGG